MAVVSHESRDIMRFCGMKGFSRWIYNDMKWFNHFPTSIESPFPRIPADYGERFDRLSTLPIVLYNSLSRNICMRYNTRLYGHLHSSSALLLVRDNNTDYQITEFTFMR